MVNISEFFNGTTSKKNLIWSALGLTIVEAAKHADMACWNYWKLDREGCDGGIGKMGSVEIERERRCL